MSDVVVTPVEEQTVTTPEVTHVLSTTESRTVVSTDKNDIDVVSVDEPSVVSAETQRMMIVTVGQAGPAGPRGPQGLPGVAGPAGITPRTYKRMAQDGVVLYTLPELPYGDIQVSLNGVNVEHELSGVNVLITEYTPGSIESSDELSFYYFVEE